MVNFSNNSNNFQEEIIFRDETGKFKVIKGGKIQDLGIKKPEVRPKLKEELKEKVIKQTIPIVVGADKVVKKPVSPLLTSTPGPNLEQIVQEVIKESGIVLENEILINRFKNVILSRLKDIRDQVETREVLLRSVEAGGLSLPEIETDKVLKIISKKIEALDDHLRGAVSLEMPAFPPFKKQTEEEKPPFKKMPEKISSLLPDLGKKTQKEKIKEIEFIPKTKGPIEEIASLTIQDFRKLDSEPKKAAERIFQKIQLLEKEEFTKKTKGIKAWRQSPLNQLYLIIGNQSLKEKKSISEIIQQRETAGQITLTAEEFKVIMELNKKLRF